MSQSMHMICVCSLLTVILVKGWRKHELKLKTVEKFHPIDEAKLLTYMKLLSIPQGLLINFNTTNITKSTKPLVNEYFVRLADE